MWEQAREGQQAGPFFDRLSEEIGFGLIICHPSRCHDSHTAKDSDNHRNDTDHSSLHFQASSFPNHLHTEFIGDVGLVSCCPLESGDVGPVHALAR